MSFLFGGFADTTAASPRGTHQIASRLTPSAILTDAIGMSRLHDGDGVNDCAGGEREGQGGDDEELAHDRTPSVTFTILQSRAGGVTAITQLHIWQGAMGGGAVAAPGPFSGTFAPAISGQYSLRG
jgi:hypothetical protein